MLENQLLKHNFIPVGISRVMLDPQFVDLWQFEPATHWKSEIIYLLDLSSFCLSSKTSPNLLRLPEDSILEFLAAPKFPLRRFLMVLVGKAPQSFLLGVPGPPSHKGAEATKIADFLVFFFVSFFFVFFSFIFFVFFSTVFSIPKRIFFFFRLRNRGRHWHNRGRHCKIAFRLCGSCDGGSISAHLGCPVTVAEVSNIGSLLGRW